MSDFLLTIPPSILAKTLHSASGSRGARSPYTDHAVRISLYLDLANGTIKSQRAYARIWHWSHKRVRYQWDNIWHDVVTWATLNGTNLNTHLFEAMPKEWQNWVREAFGVHNKDPGEEGKSQGHTRGTAGAHEGHEKVPIQPKTGESGHTRGTAGAHEGHDILNNHNHNRSLSIGGDGPKLERVIEVADTILLGPKDAEAFFYHYENAGWDKVKNLKAALQKWRLNGGLYGSIDKSESEKAKQSGRGRSAGAEAGGGPRKRRGAWHPGREGT